MYQNENLHSPSTGPWLGLCDWGRGGGGAVPDPKKLFEPQSGKENYFGLFGGFRGISPGKFLK